MGAADHGDAVGIGSAIIGGDAINSLVGYKPSLIVWLYIGKDITDVVNIQVIVSQRKIG